ncbi:MAG TPA: MBL fold metallo-hydrolase [Clostridia bacterium]|nr:MBL fold metallo-hydrolase [Clostridia bacterium]
MKLTVLGNNGPFPSAGGACSGYLLTNGPANILIDCGNGVLGNLQKVVSLDKLDAIILTHLHNDHTSDMQVLKYAVQIKRARGQFDHLIRVFAPPEPAEEFARLNVSDAFELSAITDDTVLDFGAVTLSFARMKHPAMDYAVAAECRGKKLVFSGDTSWTDDIIRFSTGADLVMLDAGFLEKDLTPASPHMSAAQCGTAASKAGAHRLLLTHFWPEYNVNDLLNEARRNFDNTEVTEILKSYEV